MNPTLKNWLLTAGAVLVIACCASWIYYREFRAPKHDVRLHQRVGEVMAEQTAKVVGSKGRLVIITIPTSTEPELKTQLEAFRRALKKLGDYEIKEHELDTKDQAKQVVVNKARVEHWIKNGAQPSATVNQLLKRAVDSGAVATAPAA